MSKTLETSVEISGVLSPSLQSAINNAVQGFEKMKEETLKSAGAGEKLAAELKRDETVLRALEIGYADFVLAGQEGTEEAQQLAQQIQTLSKELDGNKGQLEAAQAAAEKLASGMGKTETESDKLRHTISEQESTLQQLKERYVALQLSEGDTTDESRELAQQIDRLSTELRENRQRLSDAERAADELDNSLEQVDDSAKLAEEGFTVFKATLANLAADAIRAAISGIKELAQNVVDLGRDFSSTMSEVAALSGATGEEFEKLEATAREYGSTTVFSASESAQALKYMALAGWDVEQSTSALGGVLNLAAASGMDLAAASDMVTDYMSAFSLEADQAAYFADMLAFAQANSNTTAEQLGEAYRNCAANLNAAGQDVETVTSMLEAMANQGLKGTKSGTALAAIMRDITNAMDDGKISIGNTSIAVTDAEGNYRDLTDIIRDVSNAVDGMGTAERAAALSTTFTADSTKGMNLILNEGIDNIAGYEEALRSSGGAAEEMAAIMNDNLSGDMAQMNSAWEELQLKIYDKVEPALRSVVQYITSGVIPAVEWITNHLPEVGAVIAGIGAAITAVKWKSILNLITKAQGIFKGIAAALGGVSVPALAVIAAVTAIALAFMNLWRNNEEFRNKITAIWDGIKSKFDAFGQGITDRLNALGFEFTDITEVLKSVWDGFCAVLAPVFEGAFKAIGVWLGAALDILTGLFDVFAGVFTGDWDQVWSGVNEIFGGYWDLIIGYFSTVLDTLKGVADVFLGWFGTSWDELWGNAPGPVTEAWGRIKTGAAIVAGFFKDTVLPDMKQIGRSIGESIKTGWETAKAAWDFAKPYFAALWSAIKAVWDFAVPFFAAIWEGIKGAFKPMVSVLGSYFRNAWQVIKAVWNVAASYFKTVFDTITGIFSAVKSVLHGDFSGAWESIKGIFSGWGEYFRTLWNSLVSIFGAVGSFMKDAFSGAWEAVKAIWRPVAAWFDSAVLQPLRTFFNGDSLIAVYFRTAWNNVKQVWSVAVSYFSTLWDTIAGIFSVVKSVLHGDFSGAWEAIKGIFASWSSFFSGLYDAAVNIFANIGGFIGTAFSKAWEGVKSIWSSAAWWFESGVLEPICAFFGGDSLIAAYFRTAWDNVKQVWGVAASFFQSVFDTIAGIFSAVKSVLRGDFSGALDAIKDIFSSWGGYFTGLFDALKNIFGNVGSFFGTAFSKAWEGVKSIWNGVSGWFDSAVLQPLRAYFSGDSVIAQYFRMAWEKIKNVVQFGVMLVKEILSAAFQIITLPFRFIWENCKDTVIAIWENITGAISGFIDKIKTTISDKITAAKTIFTTVTTGIKNVANNAWNTVSSTASAVWETIKGTLSDKITAAKDKIDAVTGTIKDTASAAWEFVSSKTTAAWETIKSTIGSKIDTAKQKISTVTSTIKTTASNAWNAVSSTTSSIWNRVTSTISNKVNSAKSTVSSVFNSIKSTISSTLNGALGTVQSIFNSIQTSITNKINAAKSAVSNAISAMKSAFNFSWSLPPLKLPHISITGSFSIDPPSVPKFGISWYKKGGILTEPTIFGAAGNNLLAGGEAGAEAVLPLAVLWDKLESILRAILRSEQPQAPENDPDTSLLQKAGQLLTLDDFSLGTLANNSTTVIYYDFSGFTWSPQIQTAGSGEDEGDFMDELRAHEAEFFDWLEEFIKMREVAQFV